LREKTKLEILLFEKGITLERLKDVIGVKTPKSAREKLRGIRQFTLPEMKAIHTQLFPDMTMEEIFEGYGEEKDNAVAS
jgi:hypothetical protein